MTRRHVIVFGFALLFVAIVIIYLCTPNEPRYQGRTLTQWIDSAPSQMSGYFGARSLSAPLDPWAAATNAMQQMGPDAVRWLVKWSGTRDSKLQTTVIRWLNSRPSLRLPFVTPQNKRRRALTGFELLGKDGGAATTALIKKTFDSDPKVRECALECLEKIQMPRETLFPVCFHLMNDPDANVRARASACENDLEMGMTLQSDIKGKEIFLSPLLRWFNDPTRLSGNIPRSCFIFIIRGKPSRRGFISSFLN
jgi:hypothetical protein